jgi:hypothetical protein
MMIVERDSFLSNQQFGGKLVSWQVPEVTRRSVSTSSPEEEPKQHLVTVTQIVTDPDLVAKARTLVESVKEGAAGLTNLCNQHLRSLSESDATALQSFLSGGM